MTPLLQAPPVRLIPDQDTMFDRRTAWAAAGWNVNDPTIAELIERGAGPIAGGAQGLNPAVFMNNVPPEGTYAINQQQFDLMTERNDVPQPTDEWPGFGGRIDHRIQNVGVLANVRLFVNLTLVVSGTGAVTSLYRFPWSLLKKVTLNANGASAIISCEGLDLRARRQRIYRNPEETIATAPNMDTTATIAKGTPYRPFGRSFPGTIANGTYTITLVVDIPIVHDPRTLTGALFAQSDQNYLNWVVETAQQSDVLTVAEGGKVELTGTVQSALTFFSIPTQNQQNGRVVVLPAAVNWLHEFIATDNYFANTGEVVTPLVRNNGQLLCIYQYADNGGSAFIDPTSATFIKWIYAGNQTPRNYLPAHLLEENQRDYNGRIRPGYWLLDFEKENIQRDVVYPRGLSETATNLVLPGSVKVEPNAHIHTVLESLTTG